MKHLLSLSAATLLLSVSASTLSRAAVETVYLGGRFHAGFVSGYIDAIDGRDTAGDIIGELISFNHSPIFPGPVTVSLDTPDFGIESFHFTTLATFTTNSAGEFWQLTNANHDAFAVNLVNPGYGISSFGLFATFNYNPPPPPLCDDCGPPPPCLVCNPPPIPGAPEASTWLMMLLGFTALAIATVRRGVRRDFSNEVSP